MKSFKQSAIEILKRKKIPLHYSEITSIALESGILETDSAFPSKTMNASLSIDIESKKGSSDFIKISKGIFALNPDKKEIIQTPKNIQTEKKQEDKILIESCFIAKGGEHLVCSELLFRRFNASIMSVDVGVDISAIKDNKFFGIQVKTARKNKVGTYPFYIPEASFKKHNMGNIFYVFLLKDEEQNRYLVLPSNEVEKKIKEGAIYFVNNKGYSVSVKSKEGKIYLGRKDYEMGYFLNNWDLIKIDNSTT
jgi:hypothetical protein